MGYPTFTFDGLSKLIAAQKELQKALGFDVEAMTYAQKIEYIKMNVLAATAELHEALDECGWKPWAEGEFIHDAAMFSELRDVWQFLTNLMLVLYPDPETLSDRLRTKIYEKHSINYQRIADRYDGQSTKCPTCKRALDDVDVHCEVSERGWHCDQTGVTYLN